MLTELPPALRPAVTLVLGGARSGKSAYAEALVAGSTSALYLATAEAHDAEMAERIRRHRERRGPRWVTVEEPIALVPALKQHARPDRPVVVDCLTLWLSNLMAAGRDVAEETACLVESLPALAGPVVLVANEVGLGIVPATPLGRDFRDHAGRLNQAVAGVADRVVFVVAALPLVLKDTAAHVS
ncbi:MAG: bifunctional adenosylcobinamide kinase/adenosylcobinamide-phosphate guanylyltransferase [Defluviicoccus sp.]|nr:bifunctional adenosylcobinamide kinase/adenosylcobinamide-phosphate guanylyltransferase [Defluviicoccus sp.]MDG4592893.1 bifunctional adenosylcobinamide kinase/adenosylcobinamide-phosphate guanylyltransferase [Defluviicoccus sp.]MDS4073693.1 bifunctional adenosylcobinamide kinase/adenosylcobinamide-phosphate guanylyltransferase [Defluviicoccus sp.]